MSSSGSSKTAKWGRGGQHSIERTATRAHTEAGLGGRRLTDGRKLSPNDSIGEPCKESRGFFVVAHGSAVQWFAVRGSTSFNEARGERWFVATTARVSQWTPDVKRWLSISHMGCRSGFQPYLQPDRPRHFSSVLFQVPGQLHDRDEGTRNAWSQKQNALSPAGGSTAGRSPHQR